MPAHSGVEAGGKAVKKMKRGLSFIQWLMGAAILVILAAIVLPRFRDRTGEAKKESAAKANLHILRGAIELYALEHGGVAPGYPKGNRSLPPTAWTFYDQLTKASNSGGAVAEPGTAGYDLGPYIETLPENPFNEVRIPNIIFDSQAMPQEATGLYGWIYKPATKTIMLDWPGTDKTGRRYYDY